ncbi:hypothetical protein TNCV_3785451 [Trichonephila clavipes]|nr:hypothetical protein TNCV_3785451 [Trichonephila clavipes]
MADKDILEFVQSSNNTSDAGSSNKYEINKTAVPMSSEIRNTMNSKLSCLDAHFTGEMNNRIHGIEQFDAKKTIQRKISGYFPKTQ